MVISSEYSSYTYNRRLKFPNFWLFKQRNAGTSMIHPPYLMFPYYSDRSRLKNVIAMYVLYSKYKKCMLYNALQCLRAPAPPRGRRMYSGRLKYNVLKKCYVPCSKTTLRGESRFHISTPLGSWTRVLCDRKQMGNPLNQWDMMWFWWDCMLSTGLPPSSWLCQLWSWKENLQLA